MKSDEDIKMAKNNDGGSDSNLLIDAVPFYERLNFKKRGPEYMEAGMPHYDMTREL